MGKPLNRFKHLQNLIITDPAKAVFMMWFFILLILVSVSVLFYDLGSVFIV